MANHTMTALHPYFPKITMDGGKYFPPPYSLNSLPSALHGGLIAVGVSAILSVGTTITLIGFILYRLAKRLHYNTYLGYNQYVLLVLNLLIADLQQSGSFLISFHWLHIDRILAPSTPCFAQGWLIHSGDVSSGFFVLAIAIHTYVTAVHGKRIGNKTFVAMVFFIWALAYILTGLGVAMHGNKYFVRAGAWCWVSADYESERLALHYVWVFLVQFSTVIIYVVIFFMLRARTKRLWNQFYQGQSSNMDTILAINRVTKLMMSYPAVYVVLTLPLSAGRMWSYAHGGESYSYAFACVAGFMLTSCGWVDSLLYTLTRRRLLDDTMPGVGNRGPSDVGGGRGITHTRSVTVEGAHQMGRMNSPRFLTTTELANTRPPSSRAPSAAGSIDPIISQNQIPRHGRYLDFRAAMTDEARLYEEAAEAEAELERRMNLDGTSSLEITALPPVRTPHEP